MSESPHTISIQPEEIHFWQTSVDHYSEATLRQFYTWLSPEELSQYDRFSLDSLKIRYLVTRGFVRKLLSDYLGNTPQALQFIKNKYGKPSLSAKYQPPDYTLEFNLSHTNNVIVCGISRNHEIGIDIENYTRSIHLEGIAKRFYAPSEMESIFRLPEPSQAIRFFSYWTLKESFLKALGTGIAFPLSDVIFDISAEDSLIDLSFGKNIKESPAQWQFCLFNHLSHDLISICVRKNELKSISLKFWELVDSNNHPFLFQRIFLRKGTWNI
ncbi:MAG: 4'-phosphopantetheinyl transferase superfamily protein [SAR324 cluster bacterium]|nr:4'-phosphopantetheinyl transferase superfamily protein [SAR324 cluster bacterium]MBF0351716.1 4'-phosphopantetheinyl transferase superfamily protein [SAR324 cluster bacterium]